MSENREEILANFQSITAIDNVSEAIMHLDENGWDLLTAVNAVMPLGSMRRTSLEAANPNLGRDLANQIDDSMDLGLDSVAPGSIPSPSVSIGGMSAFAMYNSSDASASSSSTSAPTQRRDIVFMIRYKTNVYKISISDHLTVADLKAKITTLTTIPACRQKLSGWVPEKSFLAQFNATELRNLAIASENTLYLNDLQEDVMRMNGLWGSLDSDDVAGRCLEEFKLKILRLPENTTTTLNINGDQRILDVKQHMYAITSIPVRHQVWTGWPDGIPDSITLAASGIELESSFEMSTSQNNAATSTATTSSERSGLLSMPIEIDSDSEPEEFEDAADFNNDDDFHNDLFNETPVQNQLRHLIPDRTDDEATGCIFFVHNYVERYGVPHPTFFQGCLHDALTEAVQKPARDRKLLAIYLHHDGSVLTNVFCDRLLRKESVMQTLDEQCVLYGWDLTYEENKNLFLSSLSAHVSVSASLTVRAIPIDRLPAIVIVGKTRSTSDVLSIIHGNVSEDELISQLIDVIELYSQQREREVREESERAVREQVKYEQDVAYQESLEIDRQKEKERCAKELAKTTERRRLESERAETEARREERRLEAENALPVEPEAGGESVTKIRVRNPNGEMMERRFTVESSLQVLMHFVASKGFPIDEYKIISSWPRRDLTTIEPNKTLQELKLFPQETVTLEER